MSKEDPLRTQLLGALKGGQAHITFDKVVEGFPVDQAGVRPDGMPHSGWELLEHIRIAQNEILRFSIPKDYEEMKWPDNYWPKSPKPKDEAEWHASIAAIRDDLAAFERLIQDPARDLHKPFTWGEGQTLLREALLIVDHNSYHLGQLFLVRHALEKASPK